MDRREWKILLFMKPVCNSNPRGWNSFRRFGESFKGLVFPFGAMIQYHPISAKDRSRLHQFGEKVFLGIFFGYVSVLSCTEDEHGHGHDYHTSSRLQPTRQWVGALSQSHLGLWQTGGSRQGHPRYTSASTEEGRGWPDKRAPRNKTRTTTRPRLQTLWHTSGSRQGHTRYTGARTWEGRGWPDNKSLHATRQHKHVQALSRLSLQKQVQSYCHLEIIQDTQTLWSWTMWTRQESMLEDSMQRQ